MSEHGADTEYLPNSDRAIVEDVKLSGYLLDLDHPDGGPKARFFLLNGFRTDRPDLLRASLLSHGRTNPVIRIRHTPHGIRYTVGGSLSLPNGRSRRILTVSQFDTGTDVPRLITAYPDD